MSDTGLMEPGLMERVFTDDLLTLTISTSSYKSSVVRK